MSQRMIFTSIKRKGPFLRNGPGSGEWIRTTDLRVMSPTSYHCSTPRRRPQVYCNFSLGLKRIWAHSFDLLFLCYSHTAPARRGRARFALSHASLYPSGAIKVTLLEPPRSGAALLARRRRRTLYGTSRDATPLTRTLAPYPPKREKRCANSTKIKNQANELRNEVQVLVWRPNGPGTGLFSRGLVTPVSWALERFTTVFGMGTGGTTPLSPPGPIGRHASATES